MQLRSVTNFIKVHFSKKNLAMTSILTKQRTEEESKVAHHSAFEELLEFEETVIELAEKSYLAQRK